MGRARRTRLWIALPGGIAINGLMLAGLMLIERVPPAAEDPPFVTVSLEQPEARRKMPSSSPPRAISPPSLSPVAPSKSGQAATEEAARTPAAPASAAIDPAWTVGGGDYLTPESGARARKVWEAFDQLRYKRACLGVSNEHMTPEEKDRCWDAWGGAKPVDSKRIGPTEAAPRSFGPPTRSRTDERGSFAKQARKQERCRDYRKRTLPGANGGQAPSLREGGCL